MTLALPSTIETRKAEAATIFGSHGVPTRRVEEWKYSDLKMALGEAGIGTDQALWQVDALPDGVEQFDLSRPNPPDWVQKHFAVADRNIMGAASLTLSDGGVALRVAKGAQVAAPLKLAFNGTGHVRGLLVLEDGASLTLVESVGIADFRNVGFEIVLGEGASLEHVRVSPEAGAAVLRATGPISPVSAASCRAWNWRSRWKGRVPRRICPACRCWTASATATSPPMLSIATAIPPAPSCSSMSPAAMRAPSTRAR